MTQMTNDAGSKNYFMWILVTVRPAASLVRAKLSYGLTPSYTDALGDVTKCPQAISFDKVGLTRGCR
jgi:hypothetical protein